MSKQDKLLSKFESMLRASVVKDYAKWTKKFDDVCGYAICAPAYFECLFPVYKLSSECLTDEAAFFPPEWASFGSLTFGKKFQSLCDEVSARRTLFDSDAKNGLDANVVFDVILSVLSELESDGLFGRKSKGRFLTI